MAERIAAAHRPSTRSIYNSRWRIFSDWCNGRGLDPLHSSTPLLADFLLHLYSDKGLCPSTLEGYRTVLVRTLEEASDRKLQDSHLLSSLLAQFAVERPRDHTPTPQWDLALVLRALHFHPFEPLAQADRWALTYKTVFLTALATAKRRSKLHAFLHRVRHTENWSQVTLVPDPLFVAKTEKPGRPETRLQEVTLPSIRDYVGPDLPIDSNNCVVRAIKIYLSRTKEFRKGRKRLFISYKQGKTDEIRPATISSWIVKTIRYAYENCDDPTAALFQARAHDLRAMATSWNAHRRLDLTDILKAAQWQSQNTFTSFYLKDMSLVEGDLFKIGPFVSAGAPPTRR